MTFMSVPYDANRYLEHRPMTPRLRAAFRARNEFRANQTALEQLGITEWQFILSRLRDQGFASPAMPEAPPNDDGRPAHVRLPGLIVEHPSGNQVGT